MRLQRSCFVCSTVVGVLLASFATNGVADPTDDAIGFCLPLARKLLTQNEILFRKNDSWAFYAKQICDKKIASVDEANRQGIDLGMNARDSSGSEIPFNLAFSNDSTKKQKFFSLVCSNTQVVNATKDESLIIRNMDPAAVGGLLSSCVAGQLVRNDEFYCTASRPSHKSKLFSGSVFFRPKTSSPTTPTFSAGTLIGASGAQTELLSWARASTGASLNRSKLRGAPVLIGATLFEAELDGQSGATAEISTSDGRTCKAFVGEDVVVVKMQFTGWALTKVPDRIFNYAFTRPGDPCDKSPVDDTEQRCLAANEMADGPESSPNDATSNCPAAASRTLSVVPVAPFGKGQCFLQTVRLVGCGVDRDPITRSRLNCKGSGWLGGSYTAPRKIIGTSIVPGPAEEFRDFFGSSSWAKVYRFTGVYPENTFPKGFEFDAQVTFRNSSGSSEVVSLTKSTPKARSTDGRRCFEAVPNSNSEIGEVAIRSEECLIDQSLPTDFHSRLQRWTDPNFGTRGGDGLIHP